MLYNSPTKNQHQESACKSGGIRNTGQVDGWHDGSHVYNIIGYW